MKRSTAQLSMSHKFFENKPICVCCNQRIGEEEMEVIENGIGICKICFEDFAPVPENSPFEGVENVDYFLSAFYYNNKMKKLIYRYKFAREEKIGELLFAMLSDYLKDVKIIDDFDCITPIPLYRKRFLSRGFNQAEILAKGIAKRLNIPYNNCVHRWRETKTQSLLKKADRGKNTNGAFIADKTRVKDKKILLVDDVITTGATMNSCAEELRQKGAKKVVGVSLSKRNF